MDENLEQTETGSRFTKKKIISLVALVLLLLSIPIGVYLVQVKQIFKSKASSLTQSILPGAGDLKADIILGQPDFGENTPGEIVSFKVAGPGGVIVDRNSHPNRVYVYDGMNSRVLGFSSLGVCKNDGSKKCSVDSECPNSTCDLKVGGSEGQVKADLVLGQPDFNHSACNGDGTYHNQPYPVRTPAGKATLCGLAPGEKSPYEGGSMGSMAVDQNHNLYVPDIWNNRVLKYNDPYSSDKTDGKGDSIADEIWGQDSDSASACNKGQVFPNASTLCLENNVSGVEIDPVGNLWVADSGNNRVLRFSKNPQTGQISKTADLVLGQDNFTSNGSGNNLNQLSKPAAVKAGSDGKVYVADPGSVHAKDQPFINDRVMVYETSSSVNLNNGMSGRVFAQMYYPTGLEFDIQKTDDPYSGGLWVLDTHHQQVVLLDQTTGQPKKVLSQKQPVMGHVVAPEGGTLGDARGSIGVTSDGDVIVSSSYDNQNVYFFKHNIPPPPPQGQVLAASVDVPLTAVVPIPSATPTPVPTLGYRRVFVTSTTYKGNLKTAGSNVGLGTATSGLDGADKICQLRANVAGLGGTWKAWISSTANDPVGRFSQYSGTYRSVSGRYLFERNNISGEGYLTIASTMNAINETELGSSYNDKVWTNTNSAGLLQSRNENYNCLNWTSGSQDLIGIYGIATGNIAGGGWTLNNAAPCSGSAALYCFEQQNSPAVTRTPTPTAVPTPTPTPWPYQPAVKFFSPPEGHNYLSNKGFSSPRGIVVSNNQLIVADGYRIMYWNTPNGITDLSNNKPADGVAGVDNFQSPGVDPPFWKMSADQKNNLWVIHGSNIERYMLPLSSSNKMAAKVIDVRDLKILGKNLTIGQMAGDDIEFGGIYADSQGRYLWLAATKNDRVIRIRIPENKADISGYLVDVIIGGDDIPKTVPFWLNNVQLDCTNNEIRSRNYPKSLCFPGAVGEDNIGNVYISDFNFEQAGSGRFFRFDKNLFPVTNSSLITIADVEAEASAKFCNINTSSPLVAGGFDRPCKVQAWDFSFDQNNRMVAGFSYHKSRFPLIFNDPQSQTGPNLNVSNVVSDYYTQALYPKFDSSGNLYITDSNAGRVLIYNKPFDVTAACGSLLNKIYLSQDSSCGNQNYNFVADINLDKKVDGLDIIGFNQASDFGSRDDVCNNFLKATINPCLPIPCGALLSKITLAQGSSCESGAYDPVADINIDRKVDDADIELFNKTTGNGTRVDACTNYLGVTANRCYQPLCADLDLKIKESSPSSCLDAKYKAVADINKDGFVNQTDSSYLKETSNNLTNIDVCKRYQESTVYSCSFVIVSQTFEFKKVGNASPVVFAGLILDKGNNYKAEDFLTDLNSAFQPNGIGKSVDRIAKFTGTAFEYHTLFGSANNFLIKPGEAYIIFAADEGRAILTDILVRNYSLDINLSNNDFISFPKLPPELKTAKDLINFLKSKGVAVSEVNRYKHPAWEAYDLNESTAGFNLQAGEGYRLGSVSSGATVIPMTTGATVIPMATVLSPAPQFICTACAADIKKDGYVNGADVSYFSTCFNKKASDKDSKGVLCENRDINKDGAVNLKDLDCVRSQFLKQCSR